MHIVTLLYWSHWHRKWQVFTWQWQNHYWRYYSASNS